MKAIRRQWQAKRHLLIAAREARRRTGRTVSQQIRELVALRARGVTAAEYFGLELYRLPRLREMHGRARLLAQRRFKPEYYRLYAFDQPGARPRDVENFTTWSEMNERVWPRLNEDRSKPLLHNKWLFYHQYSRCGIALPKVHGVYEPRAGSTLDGRPLRTPGDLLEWLDTARPRSLVVKPVGGGQGKGVLILSHLRYDGGTVHATSNTGAAVSLDRLVSHLEDSPPAWLSWRSEQTRFAGFLLQEKVQQHEFLNTVAPYTTNTFRVVTFLDGAGDVWTLGTALRLGRRGNAADNWDQGGLSVGIDLETGVLGEGVFKPKYGGDRTSVHPDSGVHFRGLRVPHWRAILDLCHRAARVTPQLRSVGWDVALTPDGPVLIEGNDDWDVHLVQIHTQGLLSPRLREEFVREGITLYS